MKKRKVDTHKENEIMAGKAIITALEHKGEEELTTRQAVEETIKYEGEKWDMARIDNICNLINAKWPKDNRLLKRAYKAIKIKESA